jgi:hypothetical protein
MEQGFVEAWSRVSACLLRDRGSLGSRLHRGSDGIWYSHAQWPSANARDAAFALPAVDPEAGERMRDAVMESLPEIRLESVSDFLLLPPEADA